MGVDGFTPGSPEPKPGSRRIGEEDHCTPTWPERLHMVANRMFEAGTALERHADRLRTQQAGLAEFTARYAAKRSTASRIAGAFGNLLMTGLENTYYQSVEVTGKAIKAASGPFTKPDIR